jgi:hypothetical protein
MKSKIINGSHWPDIDHKFNNYFSNNLITFDHYPTNNLKEINNFIADGKNLRLIINRSETLIRFNGLHPFNKVDHVSISVNKSNYNQKLNIHRFNFYTLIDPLINFLTDQINLKFKNYIPRSAELNVLKPNTSIGRHTDAHPGSGIDFRMHMVLSTNNLVEFTIDNKIYYFPQGSCFIFDNTKEHEVHNNHSTLSRTHLIVDFCKKEDT